MKIVVATKNEGKLKELRQLLPDHEIVTMTQAGFDLVLQETGDRFEDNALEKAQQLAEAGARIVLSDDSGLAVDALNGEPGVFSARYAGENASDQQNNQKLLNALIGESNRKARFICVLCFWLDGTPHFFEGTMDGTISKELKGTTGFGYDPLFIPDGWQHTLAEGTAELKNEISHRRKATEKLAAFLKSIN